MSAIENRLLFLRWARSNYPGVYDAAVNAAFNQEATPSASLSGFFDSVTSLFDKVANAIPNIAQTYATAKAQIDWLRVNAERAKQGLPPLDPATGQPLQAQGVAAPPVNSQTAKVEQQIASSAQDVPIWVWIAGAGALAWIVSRAVR